PDGFRLTVTQIGRHRRPRLRRRAIPRWPHHPRWQPGTPRDIPRSAGLFFYLGRGSVAIRNGLAITSRSVSTLEVPRVEPTLVLLPQSLASFRSREVPCDPTVNGSSS